MIFEVHWHDANPWRDQITYVPLDELAEAIAGGTIFVMATGQVMPFDKDFILSAWKRQNDKLDAYILPQPEGVNHSVGVRYGAEGSEYFSPHNQNPEKVKALLQKYRRN